MILSGTASGVIGASYVARLAGIHHCLSLDIGGTSADVAFIEHGEPRYGVGELMGEFRSTCLPWRSRLSALVAARSPAGRIWRSAGWTSGAAPTPGPRCYGRGGVDATITDAMAVLGIVGQSAAWVSIDRG